MAARKIAGVQPNAGLTGAPEARRPVRLKDYREALANDGHVWFWLPTDAPAFTAEERLMSPTPEAKRTVAFTFCGSEFLGDFIEGHDVDFVGSR